MKNKIIYIIILLIVGVVSFFLGKHNVRKTNLELQNDVKTTTDKMNKIQERNEELTKLVEKQDTIIENLETINESSTSHMQAIKEINSSTAEKLNDLESSANSAMSSIAKLRENNKILREYFNSVSSITEEE